jgi:hypothetical protein
MRISKPIRWFAACLWVVLALEGCAGGQAPPSADAQATPRGPGDASADSTKDTKLSDLPDLPDTAAAEVKTELPVQDVADPWAVEVYDVDPSEDKSCHYDCFGQMYCINGQVFSQYHAPVACSDWQGACPTAPPLNCPNGCLPKGPTSVGYAGDPTTLCNPSSTGWGQIAKPVSIRFVCRLTAPNAATRKSMARGATCVWLARDRPVALAATTSTAISAAAISAAAASAALRHASTAGALRRVPPA